MANRLRKHDLIFKNDGRDLVANGDEQCAFIRSLFRQMTPRYLRTKTYEEKMDVAQTVVCRVEKLTPSGRFFMVRRGDKRIQLLRRAEAMSVVQQYMERRLSKMSPRKDKEQRKVECTKKLSTDHVVNARSIPETNERRNDVATSNSKDNDTRQEAVSETNTANLSTVYVHTGKEIAKVVARNDVQVRESGSTTSTDSQQREPVPAVSPASSSAKASPRQTTLQDNLDREYQAEMDSFCNNGLGLNAFVKERYNGSLQKFVHDNSLLRSSPSRATRWESKLFEVTKRAFDFSQYCIPELSINTRRELNRIGMPSNENDRSKADADCFSQLPTEADVDSCREIACQYILFIARKLHRQRLSLTSESQWLLHTAIPVLERGSNIDQETVAMILILTPIEFASGRWSLADMFVLGSCVEGDESPRLREPSHIYKVCKQLLHLYKSVFAVVRLANSGHLHGWQAVLKSPRHLESTVIVQGLLVKMIAAKLFEHFTSHWLSRLNSEIGTGTKRCAL